MDQIDDDNLETQTRRLRMVMTSTCKYMNDFLCIILRSNELHKFVNLLTSDLDLFVELITKYQAGSIRFMIILGTSEEINTILFDTVMKRFTKIMTHERGCVLASRILNVCNMDQKKRFWRATLDNALDLAKSEHGCTTFKEVITLCDDDSFKLLFLHLIAVKAYWLVTTTNDLGISLILHVLNLDYTRKTTQDDKLLHDLMAEFDQTLSTTTFDIAKLHRLALNLTSDSDLYVEFNKTRRGSLMAQIILGRSEEIDTVFLEAIKQRFTDVTNDLLSYGIVLRVMDIFKKRRNVKVCDQILRLIGVHALRLTKDPCVGYQVVLYAIGLNDFDCTNFIAHNLENHYIELSFMRNVSEVVERLVGNRETVFPLVFMVKEIVKSDEDTLVRLAKDEYGNKVLKKTYEVAKERRYKVLVGDLVDKLKPILDKLSWSIGVNIAPIIDLRHHIISQEYN